jgi:propanol-preferring alcohol dehydrogenase
MMHAMELRAPGTALIWHERTMPMPGHGEVLLRVCACGVCRTDLHVVDGDLPFLGRAIIPGHEIVGIVEARGADVTEFDIGSRVGVPWLGLTCGRCEFCRSGRENLCDTPLFTGYSRDGGYATHVVAASQYCLALPPQGDDAMTAPLLCAGLIGYRSLAKAGPAETLGIYGFGGAGHIVAQVARWQGRRVFAFTRPGDAAAQAFARTLGCDWAGGSDETPPTRLDAAIIFAPVGALVPQALAHIKKGGRLVCGGIYMSDIPAFAYELLWGERELVSVANLTRKNGEEFLRLATQIPIQTSVVRYRLGDANVALADLRNGRLQGAAVLIP